MARQSTLFTQIYRKDRYTTMQKIKAMLANERGEAYVGEAVKIVIAIVLGAALLAGLVLVFNTIVLPKTEQWIEDLFGNANTYVGKINGSSYTPA
jgi:hypothetical protein